MEILDILCVKQFILTCYDGYQMGYHERNAGNLSYRMTISDVESCRPFFYDRVSPWIPIGVKASTLANTFFLVTGSGKYFRHILREPEENICILEVNYLGDAYRIVWGLKNGGTPTSEIAAHFLLHSIRSEVTDGKCRVIYHAHTPYLIALTYVLPLDAAAFSRVLWQSETESPVVFPGGVGVVPCMIPGSMEIALATYEQMKTYEAVVWAQHGLFCSGTDFDLAFGLMETIEKAAEIYHKVLSTGLEIIQTIDDKQICSIAEAFNLKIRKDLLTYGAE